MERNLLLLGLGLAGIAHAATFNPLLSDYQKEFFAGFGTTQGRLSQRLQVNTALGGTHQYQGDSYSAGSALLGLGISRSYKKFSNGAEVLLGAEAAYLHNDSLSGTLSQSVDINPNPELLRFHYQIDSALLLATAKVKKDNALKGLGVYLKGGVGLAVNRTSRYRETIIPGSGANPMLGAFADRTKTDIAFSAGIGINKQLKNSQFEAGYRYINSGKSRLGRAPVTIQNTAQTLQTARLGSHFFEVRVIV